jgi:hypothetical protein
MNYVKLHLPLTRLDEATLINEMAEHTIPESMTFKQTTDREVKMFWKLSNQRGMIIKSGEGEVSIFRKLLPSYVELEVYEDILYAAAFETELQRSLVLRNDGTISEALPPLATNYVYKLARENRARRKAHILLNTVLALMNQLTAAAIYKKLAIGGFNGELNFPPRGRSHTVH